MGCLVHGRGRGVRRAALTVKVEVNRRNFFADGSCHVDVHPLGRVNRQGHLWRLGNHPAIGGQRRANRFIAVAISEVNRKIRKMRKKRRFIYLPTLPPLPCPHDASASLVFAPGIVELSFLLGIHQDWDREPNEFFDVLLHKPWGGARLGPQQRTRVTVIDPDPDGTATDYARSYWLDPRADDQSGRGPAKAVAGVITNLTVVARDALGRERGQGGDTFVAWVEEPDGDVSGGRLARWGGAPSTVRALASRGGGEVLRAVRGLNGTKSAAPCGVYLREGRGTKTDRVAPIGAHKAARSTARRESSTRSGVRVGGAQGSSDATPSSSARWTDGP